MASPNKREHLDTKDLSQTESAGPSEGIAVVHTVNIIITILLLNLR
jgi:hypothetical protein